MVDEPASIVPRNNYICFTFFPKWLQQVQTLCSKALGLPRKNTSSFCSNSFCSFGCQSDGVMCFTTYLCGKKI